MAKTYSTEIAILGAGIIGASAAYYLAKQGRQVKVVDAQQAMSGTTSQAASVLIRHRGDSIRQAMMDETYQSIKGFELADQGSTGFRETGCLHVGGSRESDQKAMDVFNEAEVQGRGASLLNTAELKGVAPWLRIPQGVSCFDLEDGYVDAYSLGMAYSGAAQRRGAEFMFGKEVTEILLNGSGSLRGLRFKSGDELHCSALVVAAGPWSVPLLARVGVRLPMAPVRSQYWITSQMPQMSPAAPIALIPDARSYLRPDGTRMLFGFRDHEAVSANPFSLPLDLSGFSFRGADAESLGEYGSLESAFEMLSSIVPALNNLGIAYYMAGVSSYTIDGRFVLGELERVPGVFVGTGCNGSGIAMSAGYGRVLAELASGQRPYIDIEQYRPERDALADPANSMFRKACAMSRAAKR